MKPETTQKKDPELMNAWRQYANEIMRQLYEAGETDQLKILRSYANTAINLLERPKS